VDHQLLIDFHDLIIEYDNKSSLTTLVSRYSWISGGLKKPLVVGTMVNFSQPS